MTTTSPTLQISNGYDTRLCCNSNRRSQLGCSTALPGNIDGAGMDGTLALNGYLTSLALFCHRFEEC